MLNFLDMSIGSHANLLSFLIRLSSLLICSISLDFQDYSIKISINT